MDRPAGLDGSPRHLSEVFTLFVSPAVEPLDGLEAWDVSRLKTEFQVSCLYSQGGSGEALCTWMDTRGRDSSGRIKGSPGTKADKIERAVGTLGCRAERVWIGAWSPGLGAQNEVEDPCAGGVL